MPLIWSGSDRFINFIIWSRLSCEVVVCRWTRRLVKQLKGWCKSRHLSLPKHRRAKRANISYKPFGSQFAAFNWRMTTLSIFFLSVRIIYRKLGHSQWDWSSARVRCVKCALRIFIQIYLSFWKLSYLLVRLSKGRHGSFRERFTPLKCAISFNRKYNNSTFR